MYIPEINQRHASFQPDKEVSFLIYHEFILNESFHVVDEMYDVSKNIFDAVIRHIGSISRKELDDRLFGGAGPELYYTGYNIRNFLEIPKDTLKPQFIVRCDNERRYVPIYFSFDRRAFYNGLGIASSSIRLVWYPDKNEDVPLSTYLIRKADDTPEMAVIYINLMEFFKKRDVEKLVPESECATWIAIISHELQHLLEAFVNKDDNRILHKPDSLYTYFLVDTAVNRNRTADYSKFTDIILRCLSPDEQRARSAQSETLLTHFLADSDYRCQVYELYREHVRRHADSGFFINQEDRIMTIALMSHAMAKYIHGIPNFYRAVTVTVGNDNMYVQDYARAVILTGYYLNVYDMLKGKTPDTDRLLTLKNVNLILTTDDMKWTQTDAYETVRKVIVRNIVRMYYEYEHMIYLRYHRHAMDFLQSLGISLNDNGRPRLDGVNYEYLTKKERQLMESIRRNIEFMLSAKHEIVFLPDGTMISPAHPMPAFMFEKYSSGDPVS